MSGINLSNIDYIFQQLLKRMRYLHNENHKLEQKVLEGQAEIARQQALLEELEDKVKILKMTTPSKDGIAPDSTLKKEMRTTLNTYIQEIDNCIALLNK